jgi:acyl-CoA dehydrogenase
MALDPETLDQLIDTVRRYVRERLVPLEGQVAREDRIPDEVIQEMREMGLFGLTIPEEHGGLGLDTEEECRVVMELGWTSPAFRSAIGTNNGIGSQGLVMDGTDEQKAYWLPRMASGEAIASFALTEPEAGSDAGSLRTRAEADGDGFVLNGTKRYITNAPRAQVFTVFARTSADKPGARGVSAFLVPADTPGISLGSPDRKMGQQGAHVCDVVFEDVRVGPEALLGGRDKLDKGFLTAMKTLDRGRLHISALAVGTAERLIDESVRDASRRRDEGERDIATLASASKLFCTEMVGRVADRAVQIFGGAGYMEEYGIERFYRDVRLFRLYEGTSQIQQMIIARNMLKEVS